MPVGAGREKIIMKNLLENTKMLGAIVSNIESAERSFKDKGLESMSCSLNKNEQDEIIIDIVGSFDIDKILLNIQKDITLYGGDKFLPRGEDKFSFIFEQMKEIRKTFNYMIESFQVSFNSDKEGKLIMDIACSLNASKFRKKGNEVLSEKKKEADLDYEEITKSVKKTCEEIRKETCAQIDDWAKEMEKDFGSIDPKTFSKSKSTKSNDITSSDGLRNMYKDLFGDKGDLK